MKSIGIYEFSIYLDYKIKESNLWQFRERVADRDLINLIR